MQQLCRTTALSHEGDGHNDGKDRDKRQSYPLQSKTRAGLFDGILLLHVAYRPVSDGDNEAMQSGDKQDGI